MRRVILFSAVLLGATAAVPAGEVPIKDDYGDISRLLHKIVVKQVPREYEEKFDWGKTIPLPPKLLAPKLPRTFIKVGDRMEVPDGAWKRIHVKLDDPNKDLKIKVKDLKKLDKGGYRVVIDTEALLRCDGEWKQWKNGILLLRVDGQADATIASTLVCDVTVELNIKKFPPELKVDPKIVELSLDLKGFNLNQLGGTLQGETFRQLGNDLMRDLLRELLKASEPVVKQYANEAIVQSVKENQGKFSAADLLKAAPKEKKESKEK
jgi:hypothetical protein